MPTLFEKEKVRKLTRLEHLGALYTVSGNGQPARAGEPREPRSTMAGALRSSSADRLYRHLEKIQRGSLLLSRVRQYLESGKFDEGWSKSERRVTKRLAEDASIYKGLIYKGIRQNAFDDQPQELPVWIPTEMQEKQSREEVADLVEEILSHYHQQLGHPGTKALYEKVKRHYYWERMQNDIKKWGKMCTVCIATNPSTDAPQEKLISRRPRFPFDVVAADLKGPLRTTPRGNRYILSMIDGASRYVIAKPLKSKETEEVQLAIVETWLLIFGIPRTIPTDSGSEFRPRMSEAVAHEAEVYSTSKSARERISRAGECHHH